MSGSEIVEGWQGKRIKTDLASGGSVEGEVVRSDAIGVLFSMERLMHHTPAGEISAEVHEDSTQGYCFIPWTQIEMMIPLPGELP